nr:sterol desaturase family protein [Alteromonas profundi]
MLLEACFAAKKINKKIQSDRWFFNVVLFFIGSLCVQLILPVTAFSASLWSQDTRWGLFNVVSTSIFSSTLIFLIAADLVLYLMHRLYHSHPWLWKIHAVHHSDQYFNVSTSLRFHPLEFIITSCLLCATIVFLAVPPAAVLVYFVIQAVSSAFTHGNFYLPDVIAKKLAWLIVTPNLHSVHHSVHRHQSNKNFGIVLTFWDRVFNTLSVVSLKTLRGITHGVSEHMHIIPTNFSSVLFFPLRKKPRNKA